MKKEIYSERGYQHGLFSRDNFKHYIKSRKDAENFFELENPLATGSFPCYFACYNLNSSGVALTYLRQGIPSGSRRNDFDVTVSLTGSRSKIGAVERKILKDATIFREGRRKMKTFRHSMLDDSPFSDDDSPFNDEL